MGKHFTTPYPVRHEKEDDKSLRKLAKNTNLTLAEITRRSVHFIVPKVLDGTITLEDFLAGKLPQNIKPETGKKPATT